MEELKKSFDFERAKAWYLESGDNELFKERLRRGQSRVLCERFLQKKVTEALAGVVTKPATPQKKQVRLQVKNETPALIQSLERTWKTTYKEIAKDFYRLGDLSDHERSRACLKITSLLRNQIAPQWKKIDYWRETGILPEGEVSYERPDAATTVEKMKRLKNLRVYISEAERGKRGDKKLEEWKAERDQLEAEFGINVVR
ncbi:MAG: hypothetical protein AAF740_01620 [Bacteroidota bacterium]